MAAMVSGVTDAGAEGDDNYLDIDELVEIDQGERRSIAARVVELNAMRTRAEITEEEFKRRKAALYGTQ